MEEELKEIVHTIPGSSTPEWIYTTLEIFIAASCLTSFLANALIIYTILANKSMRTRTNVMLVNWAINDALSTLFEPTISLFSMTHYRLVTEIRLIFPVMCILIMHLLNSKYSIRFMYIVVYGCIVATTVISVILYGLGIDNKWMPLSTYLLLFLILISLIIDLYRCCKNRHRVLHSDEKYTLCLLRIVYVSWSVVVLVFLFDVRIVNYIITDLLDVFAPLIATFVLWCMFTQDKKFNVCVKNIFKCGRIYYDVNADVHVVDE